jgi:PKD repeat protein
MHSAEAIVRAVRSCAAVLLTCGLLSGCAEGFLPASSSSTPSDLVVSAVRLDAIRLSWKPVEGDVVAYIVERRVDFTGPFEEVAKLEQRILNEVVWIDSDVKPETYYGYRISAVTSAGDRSTPSVVGGARTPPLPGIEIRTTSIVTVSESFDDDGYDVVIAGPDTVRAGLGVSGTRRISPLRPGRYTVTIGGVTSRCAVSGAMSREVEVTDTTVATIAPVAFEITCRDPSRGELALAVAVTGDSLDNSLVLDVLGQAADSTLPPAERVFSRRVIVQGAEPIQPLRNLRPGTYDIRIDSIAGNCTLTGAATRQVTVAALAVVPVNFAVVCRGSAPPASTAPFIWRSRWAPRSAGVGASVVLEQTLDLSAKPTQRVAVAQAVLRYDPAVLRYEEVEAGQLGDPVVGTGTPGELSYLAGITGAGRAGVVNLGKFRFTVIGAAGARSPVGTTVVVASAGGVPFKDSVQVVLDTFTVSTGAGAPNQAPVAQFTGPTTGTVGTAVTFNGTGSTDADGTIASYAWTFGDNTTSTVASPSKTYAAAGTYTVTLTVTDNAGATASRTGTITVTAGTTPPPVGNAPVARANGPYTAQAGASLTLSSAGTTNATSYSWALGNGQTATGAAPTVTYATAGTYTIVLTVTGANGATSTSQATATITAPPPPVNTQPLVWRNLVQAYDVANNSIALQIVYDINANVTETPGPEALRSFAVDSLKWDASRLQFLSLNYGPGMTDVSTNQTGASSGRLALRASTTPGLDQGNIVIATIRFRPIGTAGQTVTTNTFLGPLLGTTATNSFSYNSKTNIVEGQFTLP